MPLASRPSTVLEQSDVSYLSGSAIPCSQMGCVFAMRTPPIMPNTTAADVLAGEPDGSDPVAFKKLASSPRSQATRGPPTYARRWPGADGMSTEVVQSQREAEAEA